MNSTRRRRSKVIFAVTLLCGALVMTGRASAQSSNQTTVLGKGGVSPNPANPVATQSSKPAATSAAATPAMIPSRTPVTPSGSAGIKSPASTAAATSAARPVTRPGANAGTTAGEATATNAAARSASSRASVPAPSAAVYPARPARPQGVSNPATVSASNGANGAPAPISHAVSPAGVSGSSALDADFNVPLPDEKMLHLQVGHSAFIETRHRLSRVYVTNPDVLNSYTANPNQVVITAKQAGTSNFIVWDEAGDTQVYMISSEMNVDALGSALKKSFPSDDISVQGTDGRITLLGTVGTQANADAAGKMAALYGKDIANQLAVSSSRIKQVRLKVRFAEVDRSRITQFGVNLFGILNAAGSNPTLLQSTTGAFPSTPTTSVGTGTSSSGTGTSTSVGGSSVVVSNALNFFLYSFNHNIGATIQDLEDKQVMHILAEPNITAMSGQKANFLAGGEFPFPVVQGGTAGSAAAVSIIFKPYGVKLEFTPVVNADGTIDLTVAPEVSALDYSNAVSIGGYTIPALSTRRAQTEVVLRNGQSFAISGLLDQRTTDALGRTPGIASIPILGALFRSKNINHSNSELIVIVTPEIVDPLSGTVEEYKSPSSPIPLMNQKKFDEALPVSAKKPGATK